MIAYFRVSPLVRYTLYGLLLVLVVPLPFMLLHQGKTELLPMTLLGMMLGWIALVGLMSQRVQVDETGVGVGYAPWVPQLLTKGWHLEWSAIQRIETRVTGQGGRVHYLVNGQGAWFLLPMRIAGFNRFLQLVTAKTGIDTSRVKPLAQPWMYLILLGCVGVMALVDGWVIAVALAGQG
jgi:hypothetical protein